MGPCSVATACVGEGCIVKCAEGSAEGESDEAGDSSHVIICSAAGVGCSGRLRLLLTWRAQSQLHPDIDADFTLDPLQARRIPIPV